MLRSDLINRFSANQAAHIVADMIWPATKDGALASGVKYYQTGRPCKHGHVAERLVSTGACAECNRASSRVYADTDRHREHARKTWQAKKADQEWRETDRQRVRDGLAEDRQRRPEYWRARAQARRAQKVDATPAWLTDEQLAAIVAVFMDAASRSALHHVDHIIPLVNDLVCGLHVPWNLQVLTKRDNLRKGNKFDGTHENDGRMVPVDGFEPPVFALRKRCFTSKLHGQRRDV